MGSELNIAATERELAYRSKNYSDLKAFAKRELFCSSCGNILSHDSRHIYTHPIFGILQCENCKNHFKTVTFSLDKDDSVRNCHICGRERTSSYGCVKSNCPYEFCKTCIKRNVPQSLVDAESGKWKCFACNPKPLWKLRGACAAVMSSLSKRTKPKKVESRKRSSDREDERSSLRDISYVRRTQLERTNKLSKKLSSICDKETPPQDSQTSTSSRQDSVRANGNRENDRTNSDVKQFARVKSRGGASRLTSSDDTDIEEIVSLQRDKATKSMVKTKFRRENSAERSKLRTRERQSRNDKRGRGRGGRTGGDGSEQDSSSDDSDLEEMEPKKVSRRTSASTKQQKSRRGKMRDKSRSSKTMSGNSRRDASSDSSSDDSVTASMKRLMPTAFAKKPKTNEKDNSTSTRGKDSLDQDDEVVSENADSSKASRSVTTKSAEPASRSEKKRRLRRSVSLDRDETVTETKKKSSRTSLQNVSVILNDVANVVEKNSRKTFGHLRLSTSKPGSDSSSSKEFRSSKICHKSGVALHRLQDIEEDLTMSLPDDCRDGQDAEIPKQQSFALKKSVRNFFADLKSSATKLIDEIERAEKTYFPKEESMRESMKPVDASRMILDTRNVVRSLLDRVDQGETKITDYYGGWCKKTRQRNLWRTPISGKRRSSASGLVEKINTKNPDESGSESSEPKKTAPSKKTESRAASPESVVANGDKPVVVSECDSEEIFSNDETRMSISRSNAASPDGRRNKDKSADLDRSKKRGESKNRANSSEKGEVAVDEDKDDPDGAGKTRSPTMSQFSGHTDVDADEVRSRAPSPMDQDEDRASMNQSPDLFETSVEIDVQEKKSSDRETDDTIKEKISPKRKSSQANNKATVSEVESESEDGSKKATSRASARAVDESDGSKKPSSRAVRSPGGEESGNSRGASSRAASPAARESDGSQDGQSRAASPAGRESVSSKAASSRAASPAPECDISTKASSRAASPAQESDSSKKASSRAPSPAANDSEASPRAASDAFRKASSTARGSDDSDASDGEKSKEVAVRKGFDKNSADGFSDGEDINPQEMVEALAEALAVASDTENPDANKSAEKSAVSDVDSVATELYDSPLCEKSDQPDDRRASSPETPAKDVSDDEKVTEKNEKSENGKSKKQQSSKDRKKSGGEKRRDSSRRSSSNAASADDLDGLTEKSKKSKSDDSSSDLSDAENARAREAMLMSSNSDDSSAGNSSRNRTSNPKEANDSPLTPPESDSKSERSSKSVERRLPERESEDDGKNSDNDKPRKKRTKFRLNKNPFYIADEKLRQICEVRVKRLKNRILKRYSRALRKSKKYVESKEIQRLVALDKLDKNKSKAASDSSDDEDSSKTLTRNKKKTNAKEREETLMDHLKKVKNGENIVESSESDSDSTKSEKKNKTKDNGDDSLFAEANRMAKKRMLDSSESGGEEQPDSDAKDEEPVKKTKKVVKKEKLSKSSEDEEDKKEKAEKAEKGRWRKNKILTLKISDSDSDEERQKFDSKQEKLASQKSQGSDSDEEEESSAKKKKRVRRRVLHSDSDVEVSPISDSDSDSSVKNSKKKKKKKKDDDSDADEGEKKKPRKRTRRTRSSDSSMDEERPKPTRRKRIKTAGTDSDSDEDLDNSQGSPGKTGRKNIRKVLRDKQVAEDTKQAAKDEEERLKRIAERQKLYNEMYEVRLAGEEKVEKLVLDFDEETKEPLVSVDEGLVKRLKPHQAQGIKFMWDACFESLERTKNTKGSGCILAHCMGLGKSFQIVTLAHTLLMHPETGIKTVLVVCPLSTVLNWANEFKIWLSDLPSADDIEIYEMTKMKKVFERKYQLEHWRKTGGVMIIGYEMFRNLSSGGKKLRKAVQESFIKSLVDPGPDLIVCDEGHLLKKEATALSKAMTRVRTLRRIVLTGTPLQNNLIEYHCMVQFVKPNLLGTKREFMNRFENPITNGQFDDSTEYDVKLMKKRAHVLHKMLEGSVQRFDYSVLTPFLPPKQEYVIFVKLTEIQIKMYQHYLENYARSHRGVGGSLFADFQALQRIWTHPMVMQMNAERTERANEKRRLDNSDSEGSLKDFIDDGSDTPCSSDDSDVQSASGSEDEKGKKKPQRSTRANPVVEEAEPEATTPAAEENSDEAWWTQFIKSDDVYEDIRISTKLLLLFRILKECEQIGDKVLVFSQSLYSLTLIEKFLGMIDEETQKGNHPDHLDGHSGSWALGLDYFRLDGQSSADNRRLWCNVFNRPTNTRARLFLISTRAGGLGINLTAANRVIIFDASWNPSHDVQSIFRIYRFGQKKPCYVYRLLAAGTMEEKIYNRQVTKLSLSCRVVDEQQIERHYTNNALAELYKLELPSTEETTLNLPKDRLLAEIFLKYAHTVERYHEHDSLLENQAGEELDEEERQQAWLEYEEEKKGRRVGQPMAFMNQEQMLLQQINMMNLAQQQNILSNPDMLEMFQKYQGFMQKDYPGLPDAQHKILATQAIYEMYNSVERQAVSGQRAYPMMNVPNVGGAQFGYNNQMQTAQPIQGHPSVDTLRLYQQSLAQAQNGMMNNYTNNQGQMGHGLAHQRQTPMAQMGQISGMSAVSSSIDDDIVEIPSSPERNLVPSGSAPGGSGKSKEE